MTGTLPGTAAADTVARSGSAAGEDKEES